MSYLLSIVIIGFLGAMPMFYAIPFTEECKKGVECIILKECVGLYSQWGQDKNKTAPIVRALLCGFADTPDKMPKVCCPAKIFLTTTLSPTRRISAIKATSETLNIDCGLQNSDKIIGGNTTQIDEFPWMALLKYEYGNKTGYHCGGVLISSRYILTAAHCIKEPNMNLIQVRLGEWDMSKNPDCVDDLCNNVTDVSIDKAIAHESYDLNDPHMSNDIALLRLSREVQFDDFVRPICLPTGTDLKNTFEGYDLQVAGWGKTATSSRSDLKQKVSLPVNNFTMCQNQYSKHGRTITNKQLCAGGRDGQDSCGGDSGGALMGQVPTTKQWTAIGVVSYGTTPCAVASWPGIYTRVTSYVDWIKSNMHP